MPKNVKQFLSSNLLESLLFSFLSTLFCINIIYLLLQSRLDRNTGQLFMRGRVTTGTYNFQVKVHDSLWVREVISSVTVTIQEIGDDAVLSSGSIQLQGSSRCLSFPALINSDE
jgi:hypothetical protein